jgi:regulatory protein YycI of two-component signal transduction system YycFG
MGVADCFGFPEVYLVILIILIVLCIIILDKLNSRKSITTFKETYKNNLRGDGYNYVFYK